jgi:hypothetical protein
MTLTHTDRVEMLKQISQSYLELDRLLSAISDDALSTPGACGNWSGKDVIAHLGNWEDVLREHLTAIDDGNPTEWPTANRHTDEVNDEMLEPYHALSVSEVREQFKDAHFALMETLEESPSVDPVRALAVTRRHFQTHMADLARLATSKP